MNYFTHADLERLSYAAKAVEKAEEEIGLAGATPDPVEMRRHLVRAASAFRRAAGLLDDEGRLTE